MFTFAGLPALFNAAVRTADPVGKAGRDAWLVVQRHQRRLNQEEPGASADPWRTVSMDGTHNHTW